MSLIKEINYLNFVNKDKKKNMDKLIIARF